MVGEADALKGGLYAYRQWSPFHRSTCFERQRETLLITKLVRSNLVEESVGSGTFRLHTYYTGDLINPQREGGREWTATVMYQRQKLNHGH